MKPTNLLLALTPATVCSPLTEAVSAAQTLPLPAQPTAESNPALATVYALAEYDPSRDPEADLATATARTRSENRRILYMGFQQGVLEAGGSYNPDAFGRFIEQWGE